MTSTTTFDPRTASAQATEILTRGITDADAEFDLIHDLGGRCLASLGGTAPAVAAKLREFGCLAAAPVDNGPINEPEPDERDNPITVFFTEVCGAGEARWDTTGGSIVWVTPDGAFECADEDLETEGPILGFLNAYRLGQHPELIRTTAS